ncbi:phage portal protein [uncultured Capnocytophaga sp.]|uniref:phage portal protein n=1 Tax=uncultured Capnocytophaga sp. TaxID=159273 RepID=UPI0028E3CF83|nr:phage portal protein [uncultured Capnocytophaga sp.]
MNDFVAQLKSGRSLPLPDLDSARKALDLKAHKVLNPAIRRDKHVSEQIDGVTTTRIEPVARIALPLQELIIGRAVAFLFGNPVAYLANPKDPQEQQVFKHLKHILLQAKTDSLNRRIARNVMSYGECAELWYPVPLNRHSSRGENTTLFTLKCTLLSPTLGDTLYPYYNEVGDMVAFSREYKRVGAPDTYYFETYTAHLHYLFKQVNGQYIPVEGYPKANPIGKIPVIYACQEGHETKGVDGLIERLEHLLSNFADTNDYHASPKIFVKGTIHGWSQKGESGAVIEGDKESSMEYVSWHNAPESVSLEIDTLLRLIYTLTQTPDISFESVRRVGGISGVALKLLFMDAHLKVQYKREIFDEYLARRINVLKAYIAQLHLPLKDACDSLEVQPEITPYSLNSEDEQLDYWLKACGGKPLISHQEAIARAGIAQEPLEATRL